jgi:mRNA-degrading endonuclease RelE of RelBE toxin-antitoxin system
MVYGDLMSNWTIYLTRKAYKQLHKLPQRIQDLADLAVADLEEQGINPTGWDTLKTDEDEYRLRLTYRYRMRYRITDTKELEIEVFYIGHRKEAYR